MANVQWDKSNLARLLQAIINVENVDELENFFRDLFTPSELTELSNRFRVASMLDDGYSYMQIERATGMSSTTIARVSKCLKRDNSGYRYLFDRLEEVSMAA